MFSDGPGEYACRISEAGPDAITLCHYDERQDEKRSIACKFLKEVNAGDTLYSALEIIALIPQGDTGIVTTRATVHNQRGELVLDGEHQ